MTVGYCIMMVTCAAVIMIAASKTVTAEPEPDSEAAEDKNNNKE